MNNSREFAEAMQRFKSGDLVGAESVLKTLGGPLSDNSDVLHLSAIIFLERDLPEQSAKCFDRLSSFMKYEAMSSNILRPMAIAYQRSERISEATGVAEKIVSLPDASLDDWLNYGFLLLEMGNAAEALAAFNRILAEDIEHGDAYFGRGRAAIILEKFDVANAAFAQAVHFAPDDAEAKFYYAKVLHELGNDPQAIRLLYEATQIDSDYSEAYCDLGCLLADSGNLTEAKRAYKQALLVDPSCAVALNGLGTIQSSLGNIELAEQFFRKSLSAEKNLIIAHCNLAEIKRFKSFDRDAEAVYWQSKRDNITQNEAVQIGFALGKIREDIGEFDEAFAAFKAANQLYRSQLSYNISEDEAFVEVMIKSFDATKLGPAISAANWDGKKPIFILGMPRSGTTLVEQVLASHSLVHGAGELDLFERLFGERFPSSDNLENICVDQLTKIGQTYLSAISELAPKASCIVDKMPTNFMFLGPIALAMPAAIIVHCRRDPIDTCLSCYKRLFSHNHPYSYNLRELGQFYGLYQRIMSHWTSVFPDRIVEVVYEDLVESFDCESRRLIEACGLDWEEKCLEFYKTERPVFTNPEGVRRPIYSDAVRRWECYESHLQPLVCSLRAAGLHK